MKTGAPILQQGNLAALRPARATPVPSRVSVRASHAGAAVVGGASGVLARARPRIVTTDAFDSEGLSDHVWAALAEIPGATREGVLALSVACGFQVGVGRVSPHFT